MRVKTIAKVVAWNAGLLLLGTLIIEAVFGSWFVSPELWGLGIYRDVKWKYKVSERYKRDTYVTHTRDFFGLRGSDNDPESINILLVGGSTTEENGVSDDETWGKILESCLRENGLPAEVGNAGIAGQSTRGHIRSFEAWLNKIPGLRPRFVFAYIGVNEVLSGRDDIDNLSVVGNRRWFRWVRETITLNSAIYKFFRIAKGNWIAFRQGVHPLNYKVYGAEEFKGESNEERIRAYMSRKDLPQVIIGSDEYERRLQEAKHRTKFLIAYKERLRMLNESIRGLGSEPVFITQSFGNYRVEEKTIRGNVLSKGDSSTDYFWMTAVNDATLDFCRETNMLCIDVGGEIRFKDGDFYDSVHTTPAGSRKIGRFVCRKLLENNSFHL